MSEKMDFIRPDQPSKCTWIAGMNPSDSPHTRKKLEPRKNIMPNILHAIGHTPLVRLNNIPKSYGIKCEMLAKCEFVNPGGSVKDRIGVRMIEDAEKKGLLKPGDVIIEPSSGNTGIGLAMASVVKGYRCIVVMPEKMSNEKVVVLRALGAEIVRTPSAAAFDSPEGLIAVSQKLSREIPNSIILDQYRNAGNPLAHYDITGEEIWQQCEGKVDMMVMGAGTGGTVTGIGRKLKEVCPSCIIVAADPEGSILAEPAELNKTTTTFYEVEGIGYDFIPTVLDRSVVDRWYKTTDKESLPLARRLMREEGLLCGGSSGSALSAALRAAAELKEDQRCVVLLPDAIRNYMTKFVSDSWMQARGLLQDSSGQQNWWWNLPVSSLHLKAPLTVLPRITCQEAVEIMKKQGCDQLPVVDKTGTVRGIVVLKNLMSQLVSNTVKLSDPVEKILYRQFLRITLDIILGRLSYMFDEENFVVVMQSQQQDSSKDKIVSIVTPMDLLSFITMGEASYRSASQKSSKSTANSV